MLSPRSGGPQRATPRGAKGRPALAFCSGERPVGTCIWSPYGLGLREVGYVEGRDIDLLIRFAESNRERAVAALAEFAREEVAVIVACATPSAHAAKPATATIPVVMAPVADALATGLVASLARPGGNLTGVSAASPEAVAKGLEALRRFIPTLARVGFLGSSRDPNAPTFLSLCFGRSRGRVAFP